DGLVPVKPENMHLTLKFIGEADESGAGKIEEKLRAISFAPFRCSLRGVGVFPDEHHIRVVWAGCESGGALEKLAKDVMDALSGYGDDKPFSAHLTIARVKRKLDLKGFLQKHRDEPFGEFEAKEFHLIKSELKPGGPEYSALARFGTD
ncbi:MAG: RNA 2',3'-cyclic phosphodiesterase, partial [Candidatus Micrarchaeota archaeon]